MQQECNARELLPQQLAHKEEQRDQVRLRSPGLLPARFKQETLCKA